MNKDTNKTQKKMMTPDDILTINGKLCLEVSFEEYVQYLDDIEKEKEN